MSNMSFADNPIDKYVVDPPNKSSSDTSFSSLSDTSSIGDWAGEALGKDKDSFSLSDPIFKYSTLDYPLKGQFSGERHLRKATPSNRAERLDGTDLHTRPPRADTYPYWKTKQAPFVARRTPLPSVNGQDNRAEFMANAGLPLPLAYYSYGEIANRPSAVQKWYKQRHERKKRESEPAKSPDVIDKYEIHLPKLSNYKLGRRLFVDDKETGGEETLCVLFV